jgi:gluconate 5-dehydrogenase
MNIQLSPSPTTSAGTLRGKVAVVTGSTSGIGLGIARAFADAGATLVINGFGKPDEIQSTLGSLQHGRNDKAIYSAADMTSPGDIAQMVEVTLEAFGRLDILVNNAGIQRRGPFVDFPQQDWDDVIATNLTAPFVVSQAVVRGMIERKSGKVIHIASLMSDLARPTVVPYTAAKGGVRQLTRGMAIELAPHNIQVNAIAPGYFATEMNRALLDNVEFDAWVKKRTPAARWGEPAEIAGLAVFLASNAANYMTGQVLVMDGGMSVAL